MRTTLIDTTRFKSFLIDESQIKNRLTNATYSFSLNSIYVLVIIIEKKKNVLFAKNFTDIIITPNIYWP